MGNKKKLREIYEAESKHGHFYTGGQIQWTEDGSTLLCLCDGLIKVLDIAQGVVTATINKPEEGEVEDTVYSFSLSTDCEKLVSSHRSGLLKLWLWKEEKVIKTWKSIHIGHVMTLTFNSTDNMLLSGGTDASLRLWDIVNHTCLYSLRGGVGVMNIAKFHPSEQVPVLFAAGDDSVIRGWNTSNGKLTYKLSSHYSTVTGLAFSDDDKHMVSCSRDKVLILWHLVKREALKTIPAFECVESMIHLPPKFSLPFTDTPLTGGLFVATGGDKGIVRVWNMLTGQEIYTQKNSLVTKSSDGGLAITHLLSCKEMKKNFGVVTVDQNIIFHKWKNFKCKKQLIGFTDEILDIAYIGEGNSHIAVATNSVDIKLYTLSDMGCQLLKGHTDIILSLASTPSEPNLLLSCGKDNSVRLWLMNEEKEMSVIAVGTRHTASVGSIAISNLSTSFFLSVSEDTCVKLWSLPKDVKTMSSEDLVVTNTQVAHEKDINCVCVAPNDKIAATGSQDRTVKLWCTETLALVGVLRGHKRGVWNTQFSPVDKVLLTSSADCTLKLWSLDDLSCLKTLEGHEASVLKAAFVNHGSQIVSVGADGLLKVWVIRTSECIGTFDEHEGKVWALTVRDDGNALITGDSDSTLVLWKDMTKVRRDEKKQQEEERLLKEQELSNLVHSGELLAALQFALSLDRPFQVLKIIQGVMKSRGVGLKDTIKQLDDEQKEKLLKCAVSWNTNSKNCHAAQLVFSALLEDLSTGKLKPTDFRNILEGALPYTERHFKRLTKLNQDLFLLDYTLACLQIHSTNSQVGDTYFI